MSLPVDSFCSGVTEALVKGRGKQTTMGLELSGSMFLSITVHAANSVDVMHIPPPPHWTWKEAAVRTGHYWASFKSHLSYITLVCIFPWRSMPDGLLSRGFLVTHPDGSDIHFIHYAHYLVSSWSLPCFHSLDIKSPGIHWVLGSYVFVCACLFQLATYCSMSWSELFSKSTPWYTSSTSTHTIAVKEKGSRKY